VAASQILTVLSCEADAMAAPSGEYATPWTDSEWPLSVRSYLPMAAFQTLTVLSPEADAMAAPSGEYATPQTYSEWPLSFPR
jgi:hypothetical protein